MKVLFIHQNMPGQYKHLARIFAQDKNNEVYFITKRKDAPIIPGVKKVMYRVSREPRPEIHRYLINFERAIFYGQTVWRVCEKLKKDYGFIPDVICGHPGWGEMIFLKEIYPDSPILAYQEFFYNTNGADVNFNPKDKLGPDDLARVRIKNATNMFGIVHCDWAISPMFWQRHQFPKELRERISVLHDGIDTDVVRPYKSSDWDKMEIGNNKLQYGDEIVTYITRNFEFYRGFETFAKAMEIVLKKRPNAKFLVVGADGQGYGTPMEKGKIYRHEILKKLDLDLSRVHFLGYLPYQEMLRVMQASSAHIYLTVPFVLSWSMLEAMSSGCIMIGSKTQPVMEVLEDGKNGFLVDFFSAEQVAERTIYALENQKKLKGMREEARKTVVDKYALNKVLPLHVSLIKDMTKKVFPPKTHEEIMNLYHEKAGKK